MSVLMWAIIIVSLIITVAMILTTNDFDSITDIIIKGLSGLFISVAFWGLILLIIVLYKEVI